MLETWRSLNNSGDTLRAWRLSFLNR